MRPDDTHDRLGRLEKTTDRLDDALRAKDRDDAVRFTLLTERLEVLTSVVKASTETINQQMGQIKTDTAKLTTDMGWLSIAWKLLFALVTLSGVVVGILKAVHVIP